MMNKQLMANRLVEAFSPWCHHCKSLAPKLQTLYEFYYTSSPLSASDEPMNSKSSLNTFSKYYNMKFAKLDCVAFGSACREANVEAFPTIILFKDGEEIKRDSGDKKIEALSEFIEECLEIIRPGSRPAKGSIKLPKVGATEFIVEHPDVPVGEQGPASGKEALQPPIKAQKSKTQHQSNSTGISTPLTAASFQKYVAKSLDPWFIKFYAPWCTHCQAMQPAWEAMARKMQGRLNIGQVNCEIEKKLCKDLRVRGYPTILLFRGQERVEYDGLRGLGDFVDYANKAVEITSGVQNINATQLEVLEETEDVVFLYFYDEATTKEDIMAVDRLPINLIGRAPIYKTNDTALVKRYKITTWPMLIVTRDGKSSRFPGLAPKDFRDVEKVTHWMRSVWLPLVAELTPNNAKDIMDNKYAVLGILSRDRSDEFAIATREIKNAAIEWMDKQEKAFVLERQELRDAKQLRIEEAEDRNDQRSLRNAKQIRINMDDTYHKEVVFAWVDGVFWDRWIRTTFGISVKDGEKVVIMDESVSWRLLNSGGNLANALQNRRYWDETITGNPIGPSRTAILDTVSKVTANPPKIKSKGTGSSVSRVFFKLRHGISTHRWVIIGLSIGVAASLTILTFLRKHNYINLKTGGYFQLEGREGLLGASGANGKVD